MADITDPNAVRFANEQIRTLADKVPGFYAILKAHTEFFNNTPGLAAAFPNDATANVADGAPGDGRRQITAADVYNFEQAVASFVAQLEANNKVLLGLTLKVAVNPSVTIVL